MNQEHTNEIAMRRGIKNGWDAAWHMAMRIDSIHELRLEMARAAIAASDAYYDLLPNVCDQHKSDSLPVESCSNEPQAPLF